jgi:hypothetical protein
MVTKWSPTPRYQLPSDDINRDRETEFPRQISARSHSLTLSGTAEGAFRVRCFKPLSHLSVVAMTYVSFPAFAKGVHSRVGDSSRASSSPDPS